MRLAGKVVADLARDGHEQHASDGVADERGYDLCSVAISIGGLVIICENKCISK